MAEATEKAQSSTAATLEGNEFTSLLSKEFKPQTDRAREEVETAVLTLAQQALSTTARISTDAANSIQAIVAEIDRKLSEQINEILHHEDFQKLEGRGAVSTTW